MDRSFHSGNASVVRQPGMNARKGLTEYCKRDLDFDVLHELLDRATDPDANDTDIKWMKARGAAGSELLPTTLLRMESEGTKANS